MKQRIFLLLLAAFHIVGNTARADEGMWLLHMLKRINEAEMQQMGLNLSADEIYSLNQACLKDAIITLNGGSCTVRSFPTKALSSPTTTAHTEPSKASAPWKTTS